MAQATIAVLKCDRCDKVIEARTGAQVLLQVRRPPKDDLTMVPEVVEALPVEAGCNWRDICPRCESTILHAVNALLGADAYDLPKKTRAKTDAEPSKD